MLTPRRLVIYLRLAAILCGIVLCALLLGPFQGLESAFGLTDKEAHIAAFFILSVGLFTIAPRSRRTDLGLMVLGFGLAVEIVQGLTGRSLSVGDFMADAIGVCAALIPGIVEGLRRQVQKYPDVDFQTLRSLDRRRSGRRAPGFTTGKTSPRRPGEAIARI